MYGALHGSTLDGHVFRGFGGAAANLREAADAICSASGESSKACRTARDSAANATSVEAAENIPVVGQAVPYVAAALTTAYDYLKGGCNVYVPPNDRSELSATPAIMNEMYVVDVGILNLPEDQRCDGEGIDAVRIAAWNQLVEEYNRLTPAQAAAANAEALKVVSNPPLEPRPLWRTNPSALVPTPKAPSGPTAAQLAAQAAQRQAAAALVAESQRQAALAAQATAQGDGIAASQAAAKAKNLRLLASMNTAGAITRDGTAVVKSSHTGLIITGLIAAAAVGGVVYYKYGRKKK